MNCPVCKAPGICVCTPVYDWKAVSASFRVDPKDLLPNPVTQDIIDRAMKQWETAMEDTLRSIIGSGYIKDAALIDKVTSTIDPILHIDFETASECDLRKAGASRYAQHPSTMVLAVAWAFNDMQPVSVSGRQLVLPPAIINHIATGGRIHAWNANFEMAILEHVFRVKFDPNQFHCSMQRSLHAGFPGALEQANPAIGLSIQKDPDGRKLMLKMCKPRDKSVSPPTWWHEDPIHGRQMLRDLAKYCEGDVAAERAVSKMVPELPADERATASLDWRVNRRGIRLDLELVDHFIELAREETERLDGECAILTNGAVTSPGTQTERLIAWFRMQGMELESVDKEAIAETMETAADADIPLVAQKVLFIRQRVAKSSVKKLTAMLACVEDDERVRGTIQYYGAGRTGRFAGRLIQPHNFPRPLKGSSKVAERIKELCAGHYARDVLDWIRLFVGEPLEVIARCLRGCIIPSDGKVLVVFDFSQIEARVLAWLAGQKDILEVFERNDPDEDVYVYTQKKIGLPSRDAGKVVVLGLGFGTGWRKFVELAKSYGLIITAEESQKIVRDWRDSNQHITGFWRELDEAAKSVIRGYHSPSSNYTTQTCRCGIIIAVKAGRTGMPLMTIRLPSGRHLYYRNPRLLENPETGYDEIVFDGMDQTTKQWVAIRTWGAKLAENITQAAARDVMVDSAKRVEEWNGQALTHPRLDLVLTVHDELIWETDDDFDDGFLPHVKGLVEMRPPWAQDLPVACDGGAMRRYGKK
jgi:DNA polymerase